MVRNLVGLKARLTWNGVRTDAQRRFGFPVATVLLGWAGWYLASGLAGAASTLEGEALSNFMGWAALLFFAIVALAAINLLLPILLPIVPTVSARIAAGAGFGFAALFVGGGLASRDIFLSLIGLMVGYGAWPERKFVDQPEPPAQPVVNEADIPTAETMPRTTVTVAMTPPPATVSITQRVREIADLAPAAHSRGCFAASGGLAVTAASAASSAG